MRAINSTPLSEIREKEELLKMKDTQLEQLGITLTQEKVKNAQKDTMILQLGKEIAQLKIDVLELKGGSK